MTSTACALVASSNEAGSNEANKIVRSCKKLRLEAARVAEEKVIAMVY
ncbi:hypothetical protein YPPY66_0396 [Yersinia pestis PY-66]|uniref:Phage protein n=1 Tax=Yersinia pestis PY-08 TaxID=992134 RepID=A0AB72ZQG8_YERPE|nr:hypothetical protein YPPY02_0259 [Yersinia pestis PY-02]EIQ97850.1 hypothetical protein YPPY03_0296 [Yersinia pestis PY-03]EIR08987.1 hypothetical protein YPPY04_0303 [Yersinia pestis PY-04]EIR09449.1 hypothetical protein YPPY05_0274 [Yersinia pestis PY-05]EIR11429.1 hypothetical protein YPPY06_0298 [Yersinia pestis PY-06]EIR23398.1 hypothetical protein YPPY07_0210 [Yersinia pestis PY-07]EIR24783.1 hypothetical protein YPPY08_0310 [Yersinia pestis PY-08]EIR39095.1 hypothetical protein YPP